MAVHRSYVREYRAYLRIPPTVKFRIFDYLIWIENMHRIFELETGWQNVQDTKEYRQEFDKWLAKKRGDGSK